MHPINFRRRFRSCSYASFTIDWGLVDLKGLRIDGCRACSSELIERGPEELVDEIISAIKAESGLTEDERKNS